VNPKIEWSKASGMQYDKTLKFSWNDFYINEQTIESQAKEWILYPTKTILKSISRYLPNVDDDGDDGEGSGVKSSSTLSSSSSILEIGCGKSRFSLVLWESCRASRYQVQAV